MPTDLGLITAEDFKQFLQESFFINFSPTEQLPAKLIEVLEFDSFVENNRKPFSIVLEADQKQSYYPQSIYNLHHPALGVLSVFLVPLGFNKNGMKYEAVFS